MTQLCSCHDATDDLTTNSTREKNSLQILKLPFKRRENNESCMKVYCEWREHAGWQQHLVSQRILAGMELLRADVGHSCCVYFRCIRNNYEGKLYLVAGHVTWCDSSSEVEGFTRSNSSQGCGGFTRSIAITVFFCCFVFSNTNCCSTRGGCCAERR